jgi:hypothetical protein
MGVSGQCHASAALYPWERTSGTDCTGGWVGLRAGLDTEVEEKYLASAGDRTWITQLSSPQPDTILTELHRLQNYLSHEYIRGFRSERVQMFPDRQSFLLLNCELLAELIQ